CNCKVHHFKLDTKAIHGVMFTTGMLPADITSLDSFRNVVNGPRDSERNTTSGHSTSYASIGGQPSSYARVHGDVSREPAVWRDIGVVGKEQLKEVLYAKAEGIAKV
ncbi:uncharacterized protein HaLaN_04441, partial [Haematococcus lacustris]